MELVVGDAFWMYMHDRFGEAIGLYKRVLWEDGLVCAWAYGCSSDNFYQGGFSTEDLTNNLINVGLFLSHWNTWE